MMQRIRASLDGSGPYLWAALAFSLLGALLLIAQVESPDFVIWNGHCVTATEQGGLAYFQVNGQQFAVDDVAAPADAPTRTVSVCYYASHPEQAVLLHPGERWFEAGLIGLPLLAAAMILIVGLVIEPLRIRRRQEKLRL
jgi:hypothetical protein